MFGKKSDETAARANTRKFRLGALALLAGFGVALMLSLSLTAGTAMATPGNGVSSTPIAGGALPEPVRVKLKTDGGFGDGLDISNVSIVKNIVQPGGYFGWHQHGGPSWIIVTQGTLTFYDGDDPSCAGHQVSAGQAFLDTGDHTHNARNETNQVAENYVMRMLPAGAPVRIDMPDPGVCPFQGNPAGREGSAAPEEGRIPRSSNSR
jgi:hypothetical protein